MSQPNRRFTLRILVISLAITLAATLSHARAEQTQDGYGSPVAVISFAGYDALVQDLDFVGRLANRPQLRQMFEGATAAFTAGKGLPGLNKDRPWGLTLQLKGAAPEIVGFIPADDPDALIESLTVLARATSEQLDGGVYKLATPRGTFYLSSQDGFVFVVQNLEQLGRLPLDPVALLQELPREYDAAVRLHVQAIPDAYRQMAVAQIQQGFRAALGRQPGESDETFAVRKELAQTQLQELVRLVNETDEVTLGWTLDQQAESAHLDVAVTGIASGKLAGQAQLLIDRPSRFAGFLDADATLSMRVTCGVAPADVEQALQALRLVRDQLVERFLNGGTITDQNARRAIESAVDDVSDVLFETLQRGVIDGGVAIWKSAKGPGLRLAAGIQLANAARLEGTLQTLLAAQLQQPHAPRVEWDWTNIDGIRFHRMIGPNPSGGERELLVGFGQDTLYLAAAENGDARAVIKRALEQSRARVAQELLPLQMSLIVSDLALASGDLAQRAPGLAQAWQETNRQDRVTIDVQSIPRGVRYRLQLEPEVVKTLAELGANAMQPAH